MSSLWKKAFRDLSRERTRSFFVMLAIGLGIASFTAVLSNWAILDRELDHEFLASNPPSATIWTDRVDDALIQAVRSHPDVAEADRARTVPGTIRRGPVDWRTLMLFVVDDFSDLRVGIIQPEDGAWPPDRGEVLFERDALQVAGSEIGDEVTIRLGGEEELTLRLTGTVHDVGQAQARMENRVYGYVTVETIEQLGVDPYFDKIRIVASGNPLEQSRADEVAARVAKLVEEEGHPVRRVDVPDVGEHVHAKIMGLLLLVMASFGFLVLVVSGTLVVNLVSALLASQIRQIGMMKTVGGSSGQLTAIYLGQAAMLGVGAMIFAWPIGIYGGRLLCDALAGLLNFDVVDRSVPLWVFGCIAIVGIGVPLLSSAWPIWRAARISVREAMNDHGLSKSSFGRSRFDRLLTRFDAVTRPLLFAIRNSLRHRRRLMLTLVTLTLGGLFFMSALNVRKSLVGSIDQTFATRKHDLTIQLRGLPLIDPLKQSMEAIDGVRQAEGWVVSTASFPDPERNDSAEDASPPDEGKAKSGGHFSGNLGRDQFAILGVPIDTTLLEPDIVEGRNLEPGDVEAIVINTQLAAEKNLEVGQMIDVQMGPAEIRFELVGIARESFTSSMGIVPMAFYEQRPVHVGRANSLRLALDSTDPETVFRVREELGRLLRSEGIEAVASTTTAEMRYGRDQHMVMIYVFLLVVSALTGGVGALGLATTMGITVQERRREMGVLRVIGGSPRMLAGIVIAEGCGIGALSWVIAGLASWPFSFALGDRLVRMMFKSGVPFSYDYSGLAGWLVISLVTAAIASVLPAVHAAGIEVREALEYQ